LQRLQALISLQQAAFNCETLGRRTSVLLEKPGKLEGQLIGKSPWLQSVHILGEGLSIGDIVDVDITEAGPLSLKGEMLMKVAA
jgi:tRNA-2-methylthio-N6-dimethylallyladenosine synthase